MVTYASAPKIRSAQPAWVTEEFAEGMAYTLQPGMLFAKTESRAERRSGWEPSAGSPTATQAIGFRSEQVDRLSRLNADSSGCTARRDPRAQAPRGRARSTDVAQPGYNLSYAFTSRMLESALNSMMLDMLAAIARKDYEDCRAVLRGHPEGGRSLRPVQRPPA